MKLFKNYVSLVLTGLNMNVASAASTAVWTVVHGGDGQIVLSNDGSYTSTCRIFSQYPKAKCPDVVGTYRRASNYMYFIGNNGVQVSYRVGGPATSPDTLTQGVSNYAGLIVKKSETFVCSEFYDSTYAFSRSPFTYECGNGLCVTGSDDSLGSISSSNYRTVAEIKPNYLIEGSCE